MTEASTRPGHLADRLFHGNPGPDQDAQPPAGRQPAHHHQVIAGPAGRVPRWHAASRAPGVLKSRNPRSTGFFSMYARLPVKNTTAEWVSQTAAAASGPGGVAGLPSLEA